MPRRRRLPDRLGWSELAAPLAGPIFGIDADTGQPTTLGRPRPDAAVSGGRALTLNVFGQRPFSGSLP